MFLGLRALAKVHYAGKTTHRIWRPKRTSGARKQLNETDMTRINSLQYNFFTRCKETSTISLGMFDDTTGFSLIGYTYNIQQTEIDAVFYRRWDDANGIYGLCRMETLLGKKSKISYYSILSGQAFAHLGFSGFMPTISFSLEYNLSKRTQVQIGGMGLMLVGGTSSESGGDIGILPDVAWNFQF